MFGVCVVYAVYACMITKLLNLQESKMIDYESCDNLPWKYVSEGARTLLEPNVTYQQLGFQVIHWN